MAKKKRKPRKKAYKKRKSVAKIEKIEPTEQTVPALDNGDEPSCPSDADVPIADTEPIDFSSFQGKFAYAEINGKYLPYIWRGGVEYVSLRMAEEVFLQKYYRVFKKDLFKCVTVKAFNFTCTEIQLFNQINEEHSDGEFGYDCCGRNDQLIKLEDLEESVNFLHFAFHILFNPPMHIPDNSPCGFISINGLAVAYTVHLGEKYVPSYFFDEHITLKKCVLCPTEWPVIYLKLCLSIQGIESEVFKHNKNAVLFKYEELKKYLPKKTKFEEYWLHEPPAENLYRKELII